MRDLNQVELDLTEDQLEWFRYDENVTMRVDPVNQTMWCDQSNMATLFGVGEERISDHVTNFITDELPQIDLKLKSVLGNIPTTGKDGKIYNKKHYSLDVIIYAGFRLDKSPKASIFRRKATKIIIDKIFGRSNNIIQLQEQVQSLVERNNDLEDLLDQYRMGGNTYDIKSPQGDELKDK